MTIQVHASQVGLGAALLQNGKPVAFASKALTKTECWYVNIEREMLAAVFGVERFHTYVYGRSFMIESDHKLLESISRKNLADMPAWLQCMMLCLRGYDFTIQYSPGKEMVIPDMHSPFSPQPGPDLPLDIAIHHAHITPDCKEAFQQAFVNNPEMRALADLTDTGWPEDIKEVPCPLHPYWQHRETLTIEDGLVLWGKALIIPPAKRERVLHQLHQFHQGITKSQLLACGSFFWPSINKAIEEVVCQCEACIWLQSQNAAAPLTPTPTPLHPWQICATDILKLEGIDHLIVGNFYSKMIFVQHLPPGQSNANKVILLLKEMFPEHGIPKVICSDNGPQYASAQFINFCISWGISHKTSSPHYPQSNGFAEACIKSVKHALQWAKCSGANPQLALLALWATPIDTKLPSPAELLYQCWLRTTIQAKICNNDPSAIQVHEQIDTCSEAAKSQADKCRKTLAPLNAGQHVATYGTLWKIWVPATVICILPWNSYQVCTSNGSTYHHTWRHLHECSVKAVDTVPSGTTCHTAGSNQMLLLSGTTCTAPTCTTHAAHIHCACNTSNPDEPGSSCSCHASCSKECSSTNACDIPCHACAATKIQPCPHGTKMPDPGNLGTINPDCPWTLFCNVLPYTSPVNCVVISMCIIFSERGMLYDHLILRIDPSVSWSCFAVDINSFSHFLSHMASRSHRARTIYINWINVQVIHMSEPSHFTTIIQSEPLSSYSKVCHCYLFRF